MAEVHPWPDDPVLCPACRKPLARPVGVVWFPLRRRPSGIKTVHPIMLHADCRALAFAYGLGDVEIPEVEGRDG